MAKYINLELSGNQKGNDQLTATTTYTTITSATTKTTASKGN